jgi:hypothetical protein
MKELFVVVGLLAALILTTNTVNGQSLSNGTNNTVMESQPRSFTDCYASFYSGMIFLKLSEQRNMSEPELKQFFTNTCNFFHDETGIWLDLWKIDELKMVYNQTDINNFNAKYYPQGVPQSVIEVFSGITAIAGTTTEEEEVGEEDGQDGQDGQHGQDNN